MQTALSSDFGRRPSLSAHKNIVLISIDLPNLCDALAIALSCFSQHTIDVCRVETEVKETGCKDGSLHDRYTVRIEVADNATYTQIKNVLTLLHKSFAQVQLLGSDSRGIASTSALAPIPQVQADIAAPLLAASMTPTLPLKICIIGFGNFGQFIAKAFVRQGHSVSCADIHDCSAAADALGCAFHYLSAVSDALTSDVDVVVLAVSIVSFKEVVTGLPKHLLQNKLVADVLSVKVHARDVLLREMPASADVVCSHPMFGPVSGKDGWQDLPLMVDKVRISNASRCDKYLAMWEFEGCHMIEMSCEEHDQYAARTQFLTHLTGRALGELHLQSTPIDTRGYQALCGVANASCADSFDLFLGLYYYNLSAKEQVQRLRDALGSIEYKLRENKPIHKS